MAKQLIKSCSEAVDLNTLGRDGSSLLHIACNNGNFQSVQILVEAGINLQACDAKGRTALHISSATSNVKITQFLLESGADVMTHTDEGELPLDVAATLDIALILVEKMISLGHKDLVDDYLVPLRLTNNLKERFERSSVGLSITSSILSMTEKNSGDIFEDITTENQVGCRFRLMNSDAPCEQCGHSDESSDDSDTKAKPEPSRRYTISSASGFSKPSGSILKRPNSYGGYPVNMEDLTHRVCPGEKRTVPERKLSSRAVTFPSDILCQVCIMDNDYKDLRKLILNDKICNIDKLYANGISPLHLAAIEGRPKCVEVLIDCGASIETTDPHGWTPLHAAVVSGNMKCVKLLCNRGADLCATTNEGESVFDLAESELIRKYLKMMTIRLVMNPRKYAQGMRLKSY